ncbi:hypothetical protein ERO13_D12G211400v2 [Gossypium hirsutum]|uniref:Uncharacterized protein n=3 Tax=Gossypium TaxID=3633 RepID=A0A5J5P246_GOSBA|nr:hypothetical protein ES319_D12G235400v1 [Gossypium barbadense]KAG4117158.1 hypothetical protein ERO13_D12G211400v2 [Gossypium hirsutum]TYG42349.1 hypothetical protein ES288_D12G249000v1 [Gossypium darwinii]TYH40486.1 hypothetical protein ES332_D12G250200v1 [Gossypium tomentosum]
MNGHLSRQEYDRFPVRPGGAWRGGARVARRAKETLERQLRYSGNPRGF